MRRLPVFVVLALAAAGCDSFTTEVFNEVRTRVSTPAPAAQVEGMQAIPGGTAALGCQANLDAACNEDEKPPHIVTLSPYLFDEHEVTVAEYQACVTAGTCPAPTCPLESPALPVRCVPWASAQAYCAFAGKRLPTEAEWEHVARIADTKYPWGAEEPTCDRALFQGCPGGPENVLPPGTPQQGHAVQTGVLDLAGNVAEWVSDWYDPQAYQHRNATDPRGPSTGTLRVVRGGGWNDAPMWLRSTARQQVDPSQGRPDVGFRCARDVRPGETAK